jgi:hypothetical protein
MKNTQKIPTSGGIIIAIIAIALVFLGGCEIKRVIRSETEYLRVAEQEIVTHLALEKLGNCHIGDSESTYGFVDAIRELPNSDYVTYNVVGSENTFFVIGKDLEIGDEIKGRYSDCDRSKEGRVIFIHAEGKGNFCKKIF